MEDTTVHPADEFTELLKDHIGDDLADLWWDLDLPEGGVGDTVPIQTLHEDVFYSYVVRDRTIQVIVRVSTCSPWVAECLDCHQAITEDQLRVEEKDGHGGHIGWYHDACRPPHDYCGRCGEAFKEGEERSEVAEVEGRAVVHISCMKPGEQPG